MNLFEFLRNRIFWLLDACRGGEIRHTFLMLKKYRDGLIDENDFINYESNCLSKLLKYAISNVPYYKEIDSPALERFPVICKQDVKESGTLFFSNKYNKEELIQMSTSGSTGVPFVSYQNIEKKKHVNAETIFYNGLVGYRIGRRIVHLRAVPKEVQKSKFGQIKENIMLIDCTKMDDNAVEKALIEMQKLTRFSPAMLMGYSSTFDIFAKYFKRNGYSMADKCRIYGIVGGSTMLYDETRTEMEKAFKCKCVSRYANMENGFLGQDNEFNNIFIPNNIDYYIEILKLDCDEPTLENEIGRIVVTDYYNYSQPMIRYDTGDVGAWVTVNDNGINRKAIGSFGGRIMDLIYDDNNNIISSHAISLAITRLKGIEQYQFVQLSRGEYEVRIVKSKGNDFDEKEMQIILKNILGNSSKISIVYLKEIPLLSSGKRQYIVNEMKRDR